MVISSVQVISIFIYDKWWYVYGVCFKTEFYILNLYDLPDTCAIYLLWYFTEYSSIKRKNQTYGYSHVIFVQHFTIFFAIPWTRGNIIACSILKQ